MCVWFFFVKQIVAALMVAFHTKRLANMYMRDMNNRIRRHFQKRHQTDMGAGTRTDTDWKMIMVQEAVLE